MSTDIHRELGPQIFNRVWTMLDNAERTQEETDEMIHAAHASRYHWKQCGEPVNLVRGDWQVSRVYVVANRFHEAIYWAERCVKRAEALALEDWDLAFAYEALARALAAAGREQEGLPWFIKAVQAATNIKDAEDKAVWDAEFTSLRALYVSPSTI